MGLAQLVERLTVNQNVAGSSPVSRVGVTFFPVKRRWHHVLILLIPPDLIKLILFFNALCCRRVLAILLVTRTFIQPPKI